MASLAIGLDRLLEEPEFITNQILLDFALKVKGDGKGDGLDIVVVMSTSKHHKKYLGVWGRG